MIVDVKYEFSKECIPKDQLKPEELEIIIVEDSDEENALFKTKVLQIIQDVDGMQKISGIWLNGPSYEQDLIENSLSRYLIDNNIELESLQNVLLEELIECVKMSMESVPLERKEEEVISHLKMQFRLSLSRLKKKMSELR